MMSNIHIYRSRNHFAPNNTASTVWVATLKSNLEIFFKGNVSPKIKTSVKKIKKSLLHTMFILSLINSNSNKRLYLAICDDYKVSFVAGKKWIAICNILYLQRHDIACLISSPYIPR